MNNSNIQYLAGAETLTVKPFPVYDALVIQFLDDLSRELRADADTKAFPDVLTFAFWCRRGNTLRLKEAYPQKEHRIGRGLVFHIAPSNVPVNFAYSYVFGLLAGNANVVRVSKKAFAQTKIICRALNRLFEQPEYREMYEQTQIVSYGHDSEINAAYSALCDVRVIWGGDRTIKALRSAPLPCRATELSFADRYSFALLNEHRVTALSVEEMDALAHGFYNDTYLMDQNACSSPQLVLWDEPDGTGRKRFWKAVQTAAAHYDFPGKKAMDKYTMLCEQAATFPEIQAVQTLGNRLYVAALSKLPKDLEMLRGRFGLFYEADFPGFLELSNCLTERTQTCTVFGEDPTALYDKMREARLRGIDRIVPVGKAMDIGMYWDGFDVIGSLSRYITIL